MNIFDLVVVVIGFAAFLVAIPVIGILYLGVAYVADRLFDRRRQAPVSRSVEDLKDMLDARG